MNGSALPQQEVTPASMLSYRANHSGGGACSEIVEHRITHPLTKAGTAALDHKNLDRLNTARL